MYLVAAIYKSYPIKYHIGQMCVWSNLEVCSIGRLGAQWERKPCIHPIRVRYCRTSRGGRVVDATRFIILRGWSSVGESWFDTLRIFTIMLTYSFRNTVLARSTCLPLQTHPFLILEPIYWCRKRIVNLSRFRCIHVSCFISGHTVQEYRIPHSTNS